MANQWTRAEDKKFEEALVMFSEVLPDRWERIAESLQKTLAEVRQHYEALVHDVYEIDSGRVDLPDYVDGSPGWDSAAQISFGAKHGENERKKGTPWTENEHKLFLIGLRKYGKGDWRSISRNVVVTRTPTQVASHAQKYFLRQTSMKKERKRSSIHDITTVDNNTVAVSAPEWNWTGQPELEALQLQPQPQPQPQPPPQQQQQQQSPQFEPRRRAKPRRFRRDFEDEDQFPGDPNFDQNFGFP